jgi:hypothetical protein
LKCAGRINRLQDAISNLEDCTKQEQEEHRELIRSERLKASSVKLETEKLQTEMHKIHDHCTSLEALKEQQEAQIKLLQEQHVDRVLKYQEGMEIAAEKSRQLTANAEELVSQLQARIKVSRCDSMQSHAEG